MEKPVIWSIVLDDNGTDYLGILATPKQSNPPYSREAFYKFLSIEGTKRGMPVYVFLPEGVDSQTSTVIGYRYSPQHKSWEKKRFPLPAIIYDCLWGRRKYLSQVKWLRSQPGITFLNHFLRDKMATYNTLLQHKGLAPFLPPTKVIASIEVIKEMLHDHDAIVIKPVQSTSGKGVIKIVSKEGIHSAEGRDLKNQIIRKQFSDQTALFKWIGTLPKVKMLVQPYLELSTPEGAPFDIRVLVQKNEKGEWVETGRAARSGVMNGLTSNLCGGGQAYSVPPFLERVFDEEQRSMIEQKISYIARNLPPFIESKHGRMVELGLDIGIDKKGNVWIIEVNSKPGRSSFRKIENGHRYKTALSAPLSYAGYLLTQNKTTEMEWHLR